MGEAVNCSSDEWIEMGGGSKGFRTPPPGAIFNTTPPYSAVTERGIQGKRTWYLNQIQQQGDMHVAQKGLCWLQGLAPSARARILVILGLRGESRANYHCEYICTLVIVFHVASHG